VPNIQTLLTAIRNPRKAVTLVREKILSRIENRRLNLSGIALKKHERGWNELTLRYLKTRFMRWEPPDAPARQLARAIVERNGGSVLDVGCGPAIALEGFQKHGVDVRYTGVDVTPKMIRAAKSLHPEADFHNARIESLPFENRAFTTTLCGYLLEHVEDYRSALKELLRVTDKTAVVTFFMPPHDKPTRRMVINHFFLHEIQQARFGFVHPEPRVGCQGNRKYSLPLQKMA